MSRLLRESESEREGGGIRGGGGGTRGSARTGCENVGLCRW